MRRIVSSLRPYIILLAFLLIVAGSVGLFTYLVSAPAVHRDQTTAYLTPVNVTPRPPGSPPIERFASLDPAIVAYLDQGQPQYGVIPLDALGADIPPVGAYLPRAGNTQFDLILPTVTPIPPTEVVYPTSPPLPDPPTVTPTSELVATVLAFAAQITPGVPPYAAGACPPAGMPVGGYLTQRFHFYHSGIDLSAAMDTPVYATHTAQVAWADWNTFGYGNLVILQSGSYITYYAHLNTFNVTLGDYIYKGAIIGWSGSTGNSSGPHVHYETRIDDVPVDPITFEARGLGNC